MASGRTHDIVNLITFGPIVYYLQPVDFVSFTAGYIVGTFFLSPDNDIYHSSQNKRWRFLKFIWYPYTKIFKHRGVSHIPFYGMITKLLYLSFVFTIFLFLIKIFFKYALNYDEINLKFSLLELITQPYLTLFLAGLFLSELMHIFTDMIYSVFKPRRKKRKN